MTKRFTSSQDVNACLNYSKSLWTKASAKCHYKSFIFSIIILFFFLLSLLDQTWDAGLAITARAWASKCLFEHNIYLRDARRVHPDFRSVGENLWAGSPPSSFDVTRAVKKWVDEKQHYDYNLNRCTGVCGHYTQVCALFFASTLLLTVRPVTQRMFLIQSASLTCFSVSRWCGRAATRLAAPPSCAPVVSKALVLLQRRASFLFATMRQGKLTATTNTLQVYDLIFPLTV